MFTITTYIALLRGINVGGHKIIKMQELKKVLTEIGLDHVKTYIQSGNILFQSAENATQIQRQTEQVIQDTFGFSVTVILRTASEWEEIISGCPYPSDSLKEGESVHLSLLAEEPSEESVKNLLEFGSETDACHVAGKTIYLFLGQSIRTSKLAVQLQKLGVQSMRNWKTVQKLEKMAEEIR